MNLKLVLAFFLVSCALETGCKSKSDKQIVEADSLFAKAEREINGNDYTLAIESLKKLYQLDAALGAPRASQTLYRLAAIYAFTGDFLAEISLLERLAAQSPPIFSADTTQALQLRLESLYWRLNRLPELAAKLRTKPSLKAREELLLGKIYLAQQSLDRAQYHFLISKSDTEPLVAIESFALLASLFDGYKTQDRQFDSSQFYLGDMLRVLQEAKRSELNLAKRFELVHYAAVALSEYDERATQALGLFDEALQMLNDSSWNGLEREILSQWITVQKNAIQPPNRPELENALHFFQQRGFALGTAYATLLLGQSADIEPARKIALLKQSLDQFESLLIRELPYKMTLELESGVEMLIALLTQQSRHLESFEIAERGRMLKSKFVLRHAEPQAPSPLFLELRLLHGELCAIAEAIDSLAFLPNQERREFQKSLLVETLGKKQGEFYQKFAELKAQSPIEADIILPTALTLSETQKRLYEDEILLDFSVGDSASSVLVISPASVRLIPIELTKLDLDKLWKRMRFELFTGLRLDSLDVFQNQDRATFSEKIYNPLADYLQSASRIFYISNAVLPLHIVGRDKLLGEYIPISQIATAKSLTLVKSKSAPKSITMLGLNEVKNIASTFFIEPRSGLFLWRTLSDDQLDIYKNLSGDSLSFELHRIAKRQSALNRFEWINVSAFGN